MEKVTTDEHGATSLPIIWCYKDFGEKLNEDFIDRAIEILSRGTGYDRDYLFRLWDGTLEDEGISRTDVKPETFIDFMMITLECDW